MAEAREVPNPELQAMYGGVDLNGKQRRKLNDLKLVDSRKSREHRNANLHLLTDKGWVRVAEEVRAGLTMPAGNVGRAAVAATRAIMIALQRFLDRSDHRYSDIFRPADAPSAGDATRTTSVDQPGTAPAHPTAAENARTPDGSADDTPAEPIQGRRAEGESYGDRPVRDADTPADTEMAIRAAYAKLAGKPGDWVRLTELRPLLGDVSRSEVDATLKRMSSTPGVTFSPESNQKALTAADREAAVIIGNQSKHLLQIEA
ncbi:hypothetical protein [Microtetraspora niveoalba]|uniref:hypothetical protein n=1 Tax=Microtetraspora niveoalba TaxID=46175 RepID=UPI0012F80CD8|nr:hypothetical protein [Microtetraspora niveoalba]